MIGKTISHYKILEKLGEGGMGIVYHAYDIRLDRHVALKFLSHHIASDESDKQRFIHEAKAASALDHPNICTIHEIDEIPGYNLFIVMSYYEGETVKSKIEQGPLKVEEALDIAIQVARGLSKAHSNGIVHRDIKPANIIITKDGIAKIVDFGLAKLGGQTILTKSGMTLGTAAYMSPEQARGAKVDERSDIWSLGVVLYEMITAQRPFPGEYDQAVIYSIINQEPESIKKNCPQVSTDLEQIVMHSLAKRVEDRYQSMEEFEEDLIAVAEGLKPLRAKPRYSEPEKSVAVLPFINDSPDQESTYFINGVMEEILNNLQRIKDLRVISRTSVEQYRNQRKAISEIARELGVNYIVEGSAQKYGNAFRLRTQLIKADRETHLWGESFQQKINDVEDIFNIQINIAKAIANELKAVITPEEKQRIEKIPAADIEVYDKYLKARSYWIDFTTESLFKSREYLTAAIEKNPDWAPLYAGLAEIWLWIHQAGWEPPSVAVPKILENLNKALELDPDLAEAHYQSAVIAHLVEWDWEKSEREFLKSLAINPNHALSRLMYAQLLLILDRPAESLAQRELAIRLDPANPVTKLIYIGTLVQAGDCKDSIPLMEEALAANPKDVNINGMLEIAAYMLGDYDTVIRSLKYALPFPLELEEDKYNEIEVIYKKSGIGSAYEELMNHLEKNFGEKYIGFFDMAYRYIIANQPDKAMAWIEKGYKSHDGLMPYITKTAEIFKPLFNDPRFIAICEEMKLPLLPKDKGS